MYDLFQGGHSTTVMKISISCWHTFLYRIFVDSSCITTAQESLSCRSLLYVSHFWKVKNESTKYWTYVWSPNVQKTIKLVTSSLWIVTVSVWKQGIVGAQLLCMQRYKTIQLEKMWHNLLWHSQHSSTQQTLRVFTVHLNNFEACIIFAANDV